MRGRHILPGSDFWHEAFGRQGSLAARVLWRTLFFALVNFDMLKEIGASSRTNAILIPHSPGNLATLTEQMRNAMIEADQTGRAPDARGRPLAGPSTASPEFGVSGNGG